MLVEPGTGQVLLTGTLDYLVGGRIFQTQNVPNEVHGNQFTGHGFDCVARNILLKPIVNSLDDPRSEGYFFPLPMLE